MPTRYTYTVVIAGDRAVNPALIDGRTDDVLALIGATNAQPTVVVASATVPIGLLSALEAATDRANPSAPRCASPDTDPAAKGFALPAVAPWFDSTPRLNDETGRPEAPANCPIFTELPGTTVTLTMLSRTFDADLPPTPWPASLWISLGYSTRRGETSGRSEVDNAARFTRPTAAANDALNRVISRTLPNYYQPILPYPGRAEALVAAAPSGGGGGFLWLALAAVVGIALMQRQSSGGMSGLGRTSPIVEAGRLRKQAQRLRAEGKYMKARELERRANVIRRR